MKKKSKLVIILFIILIISFTFVFLYYKSGKNVNNINKSTDDIVKNILNISSYEAELEVTIESNKNTNKYKIKQAYAKPNIVKQIVQEPSNIENLTIIYDGKNMKIENTKLSLSKIYENYEYISQNTLWLSSFIDNYNDNSKIKETENEVIIENKNNLNNYQNKQILYISKKTGVPTKLEVYDNNKNARIYIKYNEIKINKIKQNEIVAFKYRKTNI